MIEQRDGIKKKFPNDPGMRKEWDELTVQKKILFECRKLNDILVEILAVLKPKS
jgi:hypothetical protein